jgi:short-subunit dehydrogenase
VRSLSERYGPWALVAGASTGLGETFARKLAAQGFNLVLMARREDALRQLAAELASAHHVEVRMDAGDLGRADLQDDVERLTSGIEVGLLIYNAAHSVRGFFVDEPLDDHLKVVDVNVRGPLILSHRLGRAMAKRGRGGIVLMTSIAGSQGGPLLTAYAASKAFNLVLAEGLWSELGERGVDVVACRAGATRTPGYASSNPKASVPLMEPGPVVDAALNALGRAPSVVPGFLNKMAAFAFGRLFPRRVSIEIMGRAAKRLYG